ncbi:unnamed protein product [Ambrosiozyma monospora]|uniref:Unnamed protein product n=1 Tax=Ambrosiozyma monospora TaxID=43982 RepID=A0ACB5SUU1_AMBMO|nr:unnamed protein product [Ambrosiozyma monospora]
MLSFLDVVLVTIMSDKIELHLSDEPDNMEELEEEEEPLISEAGTGVEAVESSSNYGSSDLKLAEPDDTTNDGPNSTESDETSDIHTKVHSSTGHWKVFQLVFLYNVDLLGSAMIIDTWLSYYMVDRFNADSKTIGTIFLIINSVNAMMSLVGTVFCKKYGPIYSMMGAHVIGTVFTFLIPFAPDLPTLCLCLLGRNMVKTMDQGPKTVYLTLSVDKDKQSYALAMLNTFSKLSDSIAPIITGILANADMQWFSFTLAGIVRVCFYEVGVVTLFWKDRHLIPK